MQFAVMYLNFLTLPLPLEDWTDTGAGNHNKGNNESFLDILRTQRYQAGADLRQAQTELGFGFN